MNRNIIGLAKLSNASFIGAMSSTTHSVGPNSDVTGMGTGSVIHQIATSDMMANIWCADSEIPSIGIIQISRAHSGPSTIPILFLNFSNPLSVFITPRLFFQCS